MKTMKELEGKLHRAEWKQAILYLLCNFLSLMLITAYAAMMFSPTVLNVLPEGGDSRKQVMAIFVLAMFGCVIFTIYAASLFFRKKSRQLGTLMALGASRRRLAPGLFCQVLSLSCLSSLAGIAAGFPFVWLLWSSFRLFLVDSREMALSLDLRCLWISLVFFLLVVVFSCVTAFRYLQKTNIIDVIHEEHKNEPVKELGKWCGPVGIILLLSGAVAGYFSGNVYMALFSAFPPSWLNITYIPVFIGLYMIMLHTVVHGWGRWKKHPYKNIIARSMMKFQGKQTVNNMLVSTVLIAGAAFGIFYIPMLGTGQIMSTVSRPLDYMYFWRADQQLPGRNDIKEMAAEYGLTTKDWGGTGYISLGMDGEQYVEEEDGSFYYEYAPLIMEARFLPEEGWEALTGEAADIAPGTYMAVTNESESVSHSRNTDATLLTNPVTRQTIGTVFGGWLHCDMLAGDIDYYVLNTRDYQTVSQGLTPAWQGGIAWFNIDGEDSYDFASSLYYRLVDSFGPECELPSYYDRIDKMICNEKGEVYWGDTEDMTPVDYSRPDSTEFRTYWAYMPLFRILDQNDFLRTFAVFLMMFLFIAIVCNAAAMIICYTRCQTIALNNRYVFDDLKKLGASPSYLYREVKNQCSSVFSVPAIIGMSVMYFLYCMLMWANDGRFTFDEFMGLLSCLAVLLFLALLYYIVYRRTVHLVKRQLRIR